MARFIIIGLLLTGIGLLGYQNARFYTEWREVREEHAALEARRDALLRENATLEDDISYYENPANREKEARSQLNYKKPGETAVIVVPEE